MDIVRYLLPEISQHIIQYLDLEDVEVIWNGIEEWRHLFDNLFWKKVCFKRNYQEREGCLTSNIYRECMLDSSPHWRGVYKYNELIESHWSNANFNFLSFKENKHYDRINYFDDEILVASIVLSNTEVNVDIIELSTGEVLFSFTEETAIRKTVKHEDFLIFINYKTLKVWNLKTKSWFLNVKLKEAEVFPKRVNLEVYKNILVFVHSKHCFYMVNLETKNVRFKNKTIADVSCGDNIIVLLAKITNRVIILDLDGDVLMKIDYSGDLEIQDVMTKGGYLIIYYASVSDEDLQKVSVYTIQQDTRKLQEISSIDMVYKSMRFTKNNLIFFENNISSLKIRGIKSIIWKFIIGNDTIIFGNRERDLESIAANNCYIFICRNDRITMWCSETGKYVRTLSNKALRSSHKNLRVTENKLAYLNCDKLLCIQNYDFIESKIDVPSKP